MLVHSFQENVAITKQISHFAMLEKFVTKPMNKPKRSYVVRVLICDYFTVKIKNCKALHSYRQ
jgi:hypothetical protein